MTSDAFLSGGGEMGQRMRDHDWSTSPLGDPSNWPQSLRSVVGLMINSRYPMFCAWGPQLSFLYNDGYIPIFGAKHPNTLGLPFKTVWPEIWNDISPLIDKAMAGEATYHENLHLVMERNGYAEDTWYSFSYSPLRDESGTIAGMFCACTETTEAVVAGRALRASEQRYRALFESIDEGFCIIEFVDGPHGPLSDYVHVEANEAYALQTGIPDVVGQYVRQMVPDEAEGWIDLYREVLVTGEPIRFERELVATGRHLELFASRVGTAADRQVAVLFRDTTLRHQTDIALRESEARFRDLADNSPMMIWMTEPDGNCVYLSRGWYEFTGQTPEEALGLGWLDAVHPDDYEWSGKQFAEANQRRESFSLEYRLRRADGEYHWAIDAASPNIGPDGDFRGYVGSVVDIHAQKQVEQSLAERVGEEVARRSQAEQALLQSQKLEALGQLTGGVAHDFNNLLTPIVGALDLAHKKLDDDPRTGRLIAGAIQAADRARTLVQRLLAFARRQRLLPQAVDIAALVEGIADLLRRSLGPQVELRIDVAGSLSPAHVDPNQLELALINLAVNARDAMPDGGRLTIRVRCETVRGGDKVSDGDFIRIDVADTGSGMDEITLDRAVEPFFTTKEFGEGTGLGLSSVQGLALQSGGELTLTSTPGSGTTVTLWLPVSSDSIRTLEERDPETSSRVPNDATVLLVDDEPLVRRGLADMIMGLGYRVVEADSAAAALALIDQGGNFDAVVTDHAMPGMTGTALAHLLRERLPGVPVMIVTGYAHVAADSESDINILSKPFRENELAAKLDRLMARQESALAK